MIDIEQKTLRAFEQNLLSLVLGFIKALPDNTSIGKNFIRNAHQAVINFCGVYFIPAKAAHQCVVLADQSFQFLFHDMRVFEVANPKTAPRDYRAHTHEIERLFTRRAPAAVNETAAAKVRAAAASSSHSRPGA